jgi:hypothetical protein
MGMSGQSCREVAVDTDRKGADLASIARKRLWPAVAEDFQQFVPRLFLLLFDARPCFYDCRSGRRELRN